MTQADTATRAFLEGLARTLSTPGHPRATGDEAVFYQHVLDALPFAVVVFDADHRYRYLNPSAIKDPGIRQWIVGKDDFEYCEYRGFGPQRAAARRRSFSEAVVRRDVARFEEALVTPTGETLFYWRHFFPVFTGDALQMVIGYSIDVTALKESQAALTGLNHELERRVGERTEALADSNERLARLALYDPLTGLPNRTLLGERLAQAHQAARRNPARGFALLFLDADGFKAVNDRFGHDAGDAFLQAFGQRLCGCVRKGDLVARLGGDEFVILMTVSKETAQQEAVATAGRVQEALTYPFTVSGRQRTMSASIGIVADTRAYAGAEEVLRDADLAMYGAKRRGRARYQIFTPRLHNDGDS